jgi:hypothetical protein
MIWAYTLTRLGITVRTPLIPVAQLTRSLIFKALDEMLVSCGLVHFSIESAFVVSLETLLTLDGLGGGRRVRGGSLNLNCLLLFKFQKRGRRAALSSPPSAGKRRERVDLMEREKKINKVE